MTEGDEPTAPAPVGGSVPAPASPARRDDLDGLRGVAIALVVLFHVYWGRVSGGVDVFLLLSGFFFLGSRLRSAEDPSRPIRPLAWLWRTARRLLPSLLTVLAATAGAIALWFPQLLTLDFARQLTASVLYHQNIELARQAADYAAASVDVSPLQHLWSMSLQGQFYLGAIVVVALVGSLARRRTGAVLLLPLIAGTVASFAWAWHLEGVDQAANYYSTWSRLWEMLLGGVLAVLGARAQLPAAPARVAAPVGLAMIVVTGVLFDGASQFPGPGALWPVAGAVLVMVSARGANPASRLLCTPPALFLGRIAYALYLWHWPLLILATVAMPGDDSRPGTWLGTGVIAGSVVLAWATHRLIEEPLRDRRSSREAGRQLAARRGPLPPLPRTWPGVGRAVAGMVLVAVAGTLLAVLPAQQERLDAAFAGRLDPTRHPGALSVTDGWDAPSGVRPGPDPELVRDLVPGPGLDGCVTWGNEEPGLITTEKRTGDGEGEPCVYGDPDGDRTVVLVGGSHSEQWFPALDAVARERHWRMPVILRQGCGLALGPIEGVNEACPGWTEAVVGHLEEVRPDAVVFSATRPEGVQGFEGDRNGDYVPEPYVRFWDELDRLGIPFVALRDNPWPTDTDGRPFEPTGCIAEAEGLRSRADGPRSGGDADTDVPDGRTGPHGCSFKREIALDDVNPADRILEDYPGALSVDMTDAICPGDECDPVIGNVYVYRDSNHLTQAYVLTMQTELSRRLHRFLR
ncbi:acyltransferase family protein [Corynebacterium sp.]|uniref:acyltransferase family protein n=1 Tax=Corynebacterium sp. TaxID=1720 RepID=UPI0026DC34CC|nr:acyltransferase family protein [Corynebacterium sp.]MDO4610927.1 acyltransferase family protein [Corynebacterium sp.]